MTTTSDALAHLRHELRTPLNHIIGFSEMLLEEAEDTGASALVPALRRVQEQARELLERLNALLGPAASAADHAPARLAAELSASLRLVVEGTEALKAAAAASGTARIRDDIERIVAAAQRLLELILPQEASPTVAPADATAAAGTGHGTILVVDDNEGNREMLSRRLARQGYAVVTAEDGRRALELLRERAIDLVLLDVMMPEMDGYEVLKRMKSDDALRHIPVLMISALDEMDSVIRCIELGAEDYLPKPFNPVLLQRAHRRVHGEEASARSRGAPPARACRVEPHARTAGRGAGGAGRALEPVEAVLLPAARRAHGERRRR